MPSKYCRAGCTAVQAFASKGGRKLIPVPEYAVQAEADAIVTINVRDFMSARELCRGDVLEPGELLYTSNEEG